MIWLTLCLLVGGSLADVTYYLSRTYGNDANTGLTPQDPWFSVSKINALGSFQPNTKFLFCYGEAWYNSKINRNFANGEINAYDCGFGTTVRPIFSTAIQLIGWVSAPGEKHPDTLKLDIRGYPISDVMQVFINDVRYIAARTPNLVDPMVTYIQSVNEVIYIQSQDGCPACGNCANSWAMPVDPLRPALMAGDGVHLRLNAYWSFVNTISSVVDANHITVNGYCGAISMFLTRRSGSDRGILDAPREYIVSDGWLYVVPLNSAIRDRMLAGTVDTFADSDNAAGVTAATASSPTSTAVIQTSGNNVIIKNMEIKHGHHGFFSSGTYITIDNVLSTQPLYGGFRCMGPSNTITNSIVSEAGDYGIVVQSNSVVSNNQVYDTGMIAMRSTLYERGVIISGIGIATGGINVVVSNNIIQRTGYNGIGDSAVQTWIQGNIIDSAMMTASDGGAIYGQAANSGGYYSRWTDNIISNIYGNTVAYGGINLIGACLYSDENGRYVQMYRNECSYSLGCIKVNYASFVDMQFNKCYSSGFMAIWRDRGNTKIPYTNASNLFANNLVIMTEFRQAWGNGNYLVKLTGNLSYTDAATMYGNVYQSLAPPGTALWDTEPAGITKTSNFASYQIFEPSAVFLAPATSSSSSTAPPPVPSSSSTTPSSSSTAPSSTAPSSSSEAPSSSIPSPTSSPEQSSSVPSPVSSVIYSSTSSSVPSPSSSSSSVIYSSTSSLATSIPSSSVISPSSSSSSSSQRSSSLSPLSSSSSSSHWPTISATSSLFINSSSGSNETATSSDSITYADLVVMTVSVSLCFCATIAIEAIVSIPFKRTRYSRLMFED